LPDRFVWKIRPSSAGGGLSLSGCRSEEMKGTFLTFLNLPLLKLTPKFKSGEEAIDLRSSPPSFPP